MMRLPTLLIGTSLLCFVSASKKGFKDRYRVGNIVEYTGSANEFYPRGVITWSDQAEIFRKKYNIKFEKTKLQDGKKRDNALSKKIRFAYKKGDVCWCKIVRIKGFKNASSDKNVVPVIVASASGESATVIELETESDDRKSITVHAQQLYYVPNLDKDIRTIEITGYEENTRDYTQREWNTEWDAKAKAIQDGQAPTTSTRGPTDESDGNGGNNDSTKKGIMDKIKNNKITTAIIVVVLLVLFGLLSGPSAAEAEQIRQLQQQGCCSPVCFIIPLVTILIVGGGGFWAHKTGKLSKLPLPKFLGGGKPMEDSTDDSKVTATNEASEDYPEEKRPAKTQPTSQGTSVQTDAAAPVEEGTPSWVWIAVAVGVVIFLLLIGCAIIYLMQDDDEPVVRDIEEGFQ